MSDIFNIEEIEGSVDESSGFDLNFRIKRNEYAFEKDDQKWKWTPDKELRLTVASFLAPFGNYLSRDGFSKF